MKRLIAVMVMVLAAGVCFAQQVVVAVAPFTALDGTSASDARAIAEIFGIELQATGIVRVVTRGSVEAKINELKFQMSDLASDQITATVGGGVGAQWVVRGQVQKLGSMLVVTATLLEVNTLEIMGGAPMYLSSIEETATKMDGFIGTIKQRIGGAGGTVARSNAITLAELKNITKNNVKDSYTVIVNGNEMAYHLYLGNWGKAVTITISGGSKGGTISLSTGNRYLFWLAEGVALILENITLRGNNTSDGAIVYVNEGGMLTMNAGTTITGQIKGDGVRIQSGGTFTMNSGIISDNYRFGVRLFSAGVFIMNNGSIKNNMEGVGVQGSGRVTMNDGLISTNKDIGVQVGIDDADSGGVFEMLGGAIRDNYYGVALAMGGSSGTFYMRGGTITGNEYIGVSYVEGRNTFRRTGGDIYGNGFNKKPGAGDISP